MENAKQTIAYLGPEGTYTHLVARLRFGDRATLIPCPSIPHIFEYASTHPDAYGVVPIENSSGGTIYETVDLLVEGAHPLSIREELALNVKLALLGHDPKHIDTIYSHFIPLHHCEAWLKSQYPQATQIATKSTAEAAQKAAEQPNAAALGAHTSAEVYNLKVLVYPVLDDVLNLTQFFVLGGVPLPSASEARRTSMVVRLINSPGSLCSFLEPLRDHQINLTRIVSRPVPRQPQTYVFFMEMEGAADTDKVKQALSETQHATESIRILGSYPVLPPYDS